MNGVHHDQNQNNHLRLLLHHHSCIRINCNGQHGQRIRNPCRSLDVLLFGNLPTHRPRNRQRSPCTKYYVSHYWHKGQRISGVCKIQCQGRNLHCMRKNLVDLGKHWQSIFSEVCRRYVPEANLLISRGRTQMSIFSLRHPTPLDTAPSRTVEQGRGTERPCGTGRRARGAPASRSPRADTADHGRSPGTRRSRWPAPAGTATCAGPAPHAWVHMPRRRETRTALPGTGPHRPRRPPHRTRRAEGPRARQGGHNSALPEAVMLRLSPLLSPLRIIELTLRVESGKPGPDAHSSLDMESMTPAARNQPEGM